MTQYSKKIEPQTATISNGATMRIIYSNKGGIKYQTMAVQSVGVNPTLPYWIFGLQEKIHYVDILKTISNETNQLTWLLPDSKVYMGVGNENRVYLKYQINGFPIKFATIALLMILGYFVLKFSKEEEEADLKEAEQVLPMF